MHVIVFTCKICTMHNMWTIICAMHNMCAEICAMHSMCAKICACHNIYNICMQKYVHVIFPGYISNFIIQQNIFMIFIIYMSIPCSWEKMCMSMNLFFYMQCILAIDQNYIKKYKKNVQTGGDVVHCRMQLICLSFRISLSSLSSCSL